MEYLLTLFLCVATTNTCSPPMEHTTRYKDLYDCLRDGYQQSIVSTEVVGREDTNKLGVSVRFICKKVKTEDI